MNILKRFFIACSRAFHRHGYGIHPPFAFDLITSVIYGRYSYYAYERLYALRWKVPSGLPHYSLRTDKLLFRLVNRFQPETVVEVGTGSGLSICYMAAAKKSARYITMDEKRNESVATMLEQASVVYHVVGSGSHLKSVSDTGTFDVGSLAERSEAGHQKASEHALLLDLRDVLQNLPSFDLLHIAHTVDYEAVFEEALSHVTSRSLIIVEGIYESKAKRAWWKRVVADERTRVTFDLYDMGLVFFDTSSPKQHFVA